MHLCKFCSKECLTVHSVRAHQAVCKSNPNGKNVSDWATGNKMTTSWNAGLKGDPRCQVKESTRQKLSASTAKRNQNESISTREKRRETIAKKVQSGEWHVSLAKSMHKTYNGESFHGSWEVAYAKFLDSHQTPWDRNVISFEYEFEGKIRRYTPDFYLPLDDIFVEIKGHVTEKDLAKWQHFPRELVVLTFKELKEMNVI